MNLQLLEIGQAIYAGADEAHAWLEGAMCVDSPVHS